MAYQDIGKGSNSSERNNPEQLESGVFSDNFGGWSTIASPLNIPYEKSPDLQNVNIDIAGNISKRQGTKVVNWDKAPGDAREGATAIPFVSSLGYNYMMLKRAKALYIVGIENDTFSHVMTKPNLWSNDASPIRPNYVSTSEVEPRVIFCTGVDTVYQVRSVEQQQAFNGAATTSIVFDNVERFKGANTANLFIYRNREYQTYTGVSYNAGTKQLTVTGLPAFTGTYEFDLVLFIANWFAEALTYKGDRFSQATTRYNSVQTDQNVEIPSKLRDDIFTSDTNPSQYAYQAYKSTINGDFYSYSSISEPATYNDYAYGDGSRYVYAAGKKVSISPVYVTFGGIPGSVCNAAGDVPGAGATLCNPQPVVIARRRKHNFAGSSGLPGSKITVTLNGSVVPFAAAGVPSATYGAYHLLNKDATSFLADTFTPSYGIAFEAATTIGVPANADIVITNNTINHGGSVWSNTLDNYIDFAGIATYGFGLFANTSTGSYPTNVAVYQGRLVLAGYLNSALTITFSDVYNSVDPTRNFSSFQVDAFATSATDPFDLQLSSTPDDYITGMVEWQNSLFVFTRRSVFRIHSGNNILTPSNNFVEFVSNVGLVNSYSMCRTDKSILYLSDSGVYDLSSTQENNNYLAGEKSIDIRNKFGITRDPAYETLSWMSFDRDNKIVYLGYPQNKITKTCYHLYVYDTFRESWSRYYTPGGWQTYVGTPYTDRIQGGKFLLLGSMYRDGSNNPLDYYLVRMNYEKYIDFAQEFVGTGSPQSFDVFPIQTYATTTTVNVAEYSYTQTKTGYRYGYDSLPITSVEDVIVQQNGVLLTFGKDWVKLPNGNILLLASPQALVSLNISPRIPVVDSPQGKVLYNAPDLISLQPIAVYIDNVFTIPNHGVTYQISGGAAFGNQATVITLTAAPSAKIIIGQMYPFYYSTPLLTQKDLSTKKRTKSALVFVNNEAGQDTYTIADVNLAAGQSPEQLVGIAKNRFNLSLSLRIEDSYQTQDFYDTYGYDALMWGDSFYGVTTPSSQFYRTGLFKVPLQGMGYSYQLIMWSFDETTATVSGYQILATLKGSKYQSWNR